MKTIAGNIIEKINPYGTYTLYGGCALQDGKTIRFPGGVQLKEKRNDKGRCTMALYQYADDSQIKFTWTENNGPKLIEVKGGSL